MKKIITLLVAFVLGLLACDLVSAQIYQLPANPQLFQAQPQQTYIPGLADKARQVQVPQYIPGLTDRARQVQTPTLADRIRQLDPQRTRDLLGKINPGSPSLQLPTPQLQPIPQPGVLPQDVLDLPPGFELAPVDPVGPGIPHAPPQLMPVPEQKGPTVEFGPNGPVISFDNGPTIHVPARQILDRIRDRRQQAQPQRGVPQGQQPIYDQYGNFLGYR